jgi:hypothetical protein
LPGHHPADVIRGHADKGKEGNQTLVMEMVFLIILGFSGLFSDRVDTVTPRFNELLIHPNEMLLHTKNI